MWALYNIYESAKIDNGTEIFMTLKVFLYGIEYSMFQIFIF